MIKSGLIFPDGFMEELNGSFKLISELDYFIFFMGVEHDLKFTQG